MKLHLKQGQKVQLAFVSVAAFFLLFLLVIMMSRSCSRQSVFQAASVLDQWNEVDAIVDEAAGDSSELQIKNFSRVQIKNGKPAWEVKAKEGNYFAQQGITQVTDAWVKVYRESDSHVTLSADSATLHLSEEGEGLELADLKGDIEVWVDEDIEVKTQRASFSREDNIVTAPSDVLVRGEAFTVKGGDLNFDINSKVLKLGQNVHSKFVPGSSFSGVKDVANQ